jgi:hypothetical protein
MLNQELYGSELCNEDGAARQSGIEKREGPNMKFLGALVLLLFLPAPAFCSKIKHTTANGANFSYVEKGHGTPILLVHGSLSDFTMWSAQLDVLGQNHRVVALSRRYHWPNASKEDPKDYTAQLHANDVAAIIQALKLGPVHLVGHSYGGFICAYVAKEHPELGRCGGGYARIGFPGNRQKEFLNHTFANYTLQRLSL